MFSPKVAMEVGSKMGVVKEVKKRQKQEAQSLFMRVKVSLPISKPIQRRGYVARSDGGCTWVTFKYERLPMFCHYCGLGHDIRRCASHYATSKNGNEVVCQYGDWLKVLGAQQGSPSKKGSTKSTPHKEAVREENNDNGSPNQQVNPSLAMASTTTNPTEHGIHKIGNHRILGTVIDL